MFKLLMYLNSFVMIVVVVFLLLPIVYIFAWVMTPVRTIQLLIWPNSKPFHTAPMNFLTKELDKYATYIKRG